MSTKKEGSCMNPILDDIYHANDGNEIIGMVMFCDDIGMKKSDIITKIREEFFLDFFEALYYINLYIKDRSLNNKSDKGEF